MKTIKNLVVTIGCSVLIYACHKTNVSTYDPLVNTYKMAGIYHMSGYTYINGVPKTYMAYDETITVISKDTIYSTGLNNFYFWYISSDIHDSTITFLANWPYPGQTTYYDTIIYSYSKGKLRHAGIYDSLWTSFNSQ